MALFQRVKQELIDIVEWVQDPQDRLVWRYPRYRNEIKQGAQLIVRPGQVAVFVCQGRLADVFQPGTYRLETGNLPVLSTLLGWKHGFESSIKSEVYFVSTRQVTDLKWGTPNPIILRDPELGTIRLRAFGNYSLRVADPTTLLTQVVGTQTETGPGDLDELVRSQIVSSLADLLARSRLPIADMAANYGQLSEQLRLAVVERLHNQIGLDLPYLVIVNLSMPDEVEGAIDARTSIRVLDDLDRFQSYQVAKSFLAAAENPSGTQAGVGLGLGIALAGQLLQQAQAPTKPTQAPSQLTDQWYFWMDGQAQGPVSATFLEQGIAAGRIASSVLVWGPGVSVWTEIGTISRFQSARPLLPPRPSN